MQFALLHSVAACHLYYSNWVQLSLHLEKIHPIACTALHCLMSLPDLASHVT